MQYHVLTVTRGAVSSPLWNPLCFVTRSDAVEGSMHVSLSLAGDHVIKLTEQVMSGPINEFQTWMP